VLESESVRSSNSTVGSVIADPSCDGSSRTFLAWQL
jgi:hypothetical protein